MLSALYANHCNQALQLPIRRPPIIHPNMTSKPGEHELTLQCRTLSSCYGDRKHLDVKVEQASTLSFTVLSLLQHMPTINKAKNHSLCRTRKCSTKLHNLKRKLIAEDPVKVPRASIAEPGEENPHSTVERGFSSKLVDFSAKFKN